MACTKATLVLLSVLAAYCIVGLQIRNGFFDLLNAAGSATPLKLPGSSENVITTITGITAIDQHLVGLLMFFWPTVSAESPSLSLFAVYMAAQILPVHTLVLLEGLRAKNSRKVIYYSTVWGVVYQTIPWGVIMPIYVAVYLWTSPIAQIASSKSVKGLANRLSIESTQLAVLPLSLSLGYIIPTLLPALVPTIAQQQVLLVVWQGFPIWIAISQYTLTMIYSLIVPNSVKTQASKTSLKHLKAVYIFSLSISTLIHTAVIILAAVPKSRPSFFIPTEVTLASVFLPMSPFSTTKVEHIHEGCLILLQYDMYFACGAAIMWAVVMLRNANIKSTPYWLVVKALFLSLLVGPGGAALAMVWVRDEKILGEEIEKGGKSS